MKKNREDKRSLTYAESGVDYSTLDPFKRLAQAAARTTADTVLRLGVVEQDWSRGESAYVQCLPNGTYLAHVEEGLGSKNLVADAMYGLIKRWFYDQIAQDTVAMIVNDLITVGALPISVAMHLAVGSNNWLKEDGRNRSLIKGWRRACELAGCAWGGGETPTLKGLISPTAAVIAGSAVGLATEKHLIRERIADGDKIIVLSGSGIHANGLTLARELAGRLPQNYLTPLPDGRSYGETLLDPTPIYVRAIEAVQQAGIDVHYAVNITGHGWRKLMRAVEPFEYVVTRLPKVQPIFKFLQQHGDIDEIEMYGNFNMGAGFALYVSAEDEIRTVRALRQSGQKAFCAGHIRQTGRKRVIIEERGLIFDDGSLTVR